MPRYLFVGDIVRPGRVIIESETKDEAIQIADNNQFDEVYDEDNHDGLAAFNWNGDDSDIEEIND